MKKPSTWAGIFGVILIATNVIGAAILLTNLSILPKVNIALIVGSVFNLALGLFLIGLFIKGRQKEDAAKAVEPHVVNSTEDIAVLTRYRNWIVAFVLAFEVIGSTQLWILNDYTAGFTLINLTVIFDALINILIAYFAFELFRGKKNVLSPLFFTILVFSIVEAGLAALMYQWAGAVYALLFGFYILFAIKISVNRKNFRISHLVILPLIFLASFAVPLIDNQKINELQKNQALLEGKYTNDSGVISSSYALFFQRQAPNRAEIQNVIDGVHKRESRKQEILTNISALEIEYKNDLPRVQQQEALEYLNFKRQVIALDAEQGEKLENFMEYALTLNFANLTQKQLDEIIERRNEIDSYGEKFTQLQYEIQQAHLNY